MESPKLTLKHLKKVKMIAFDEENKTVQFGVGDDTSDVSSRIMNEFGDRKFHCNHATSVTILDIIQAVTGKMFSAVEVTGKNMMVFVREDHPRFPKK